MKTLEPLIKALKEVKDELEKAIKPGPTLDYSQINKKPDRAAQEAAAPTIDYTNRVAGPKVNSALDRVKAAQAKLDAEANETALETIRRRQQMNKQEANMSYEGAANQVGAGDDMAMSEAEPHLDDPHHEAKEKKIGKKIKEEAQDLLDMHKGCDMDMVKAHTNGQWYLEKASTDEDIAEVYEQEITNPGHKSSTGTRLPVGGAKAKPWATGGRGSTKIQTNIEAKQQKAMSAANPVKRTVIKDEDEGK